MNKTPTVESQQDRILAMHEDGLTARQIFEELSKDSGTVSIGSVYATLNKFKLKPNKIRLLLLSSDSEGAVRDFRARFEGISGRMTDESMVDNQEEIEHFIMLVYLTAQKRGEERVIKLLKEKYLAYCKQQNGLPYCKNCGLDLAEIESDLTTNHER